jgi:hypothetical protein
MHLTLVIAMVAIAQFSHKVDSCGFANDRFNLDPLTKYFPSNYNDLGVLKGIYIHLQKTVY